MKSAVFQSFLVVLGVVLAFAANEWREASLERRKAEIALAAIRAELVANRDAVAASAAYHREKLALIAERSRQDALLSVKDFPRGFISPATLSTSAWTSAAETGALSKMEFAEIVKLSRLYDMQSVYHNQSVTAGTIIYQRMFDNGVESIPANSEGLNALISTFLYRENALVAAYDALSAPAAKEPRPG